MGTDAQDRAERLAQMVERVGNKGYKPDAYRHLADDRLQPVPKDRAENLATLEAWLLDKLGCCCFRVVYEAGRWFAEWRSVLPGDEHWTMAGKADGGTEDEARAESAMQAVEAILKEEAKAQADTVTGNENGNSERTDNGDAS